MIAFTQLPDEPSEAYEPLLLHRHFEPDRQFSKTAEALGCSESTLRRRAEQRPWGTRLAEYDAALMREVSQAGAKANLEGYEMKTRDHPATSTRTGRKGWPSRRRASIGDGRSIQDLARAHKH